MKKKPKSNSTSLTCGTRTAFEAHLRRNERPCSLCLPFVTTYTDAEIISLRKELFDNTREQSIWDKYSITLETFQRIFIEQDSRCGCCGSRDSGKSSWSIDHDHVTGKIRGILCSNCNSGIVLLGDQLSGIRQAEAYLLAHDKRDGHPKDLIPPPRRELVPKISRLMQRCFYFFSQGLPPAQIVIIMRLEPALVKNLEDLWIQRGRPSVENTEHALKIHRNPLGFGCECGFESPILGPDRIQEAIERVNAHIDETKDAETSQTSQITVTKQDRLRAVAAARLWDIEQDHLKEVERARLKESAEQERLNVLEKEREDAAESDKVRQAALQQAEKARQPALRKLEEICFQFLDNHGGDRDLLLRAMEAANATHTDFSQINVKYAELKKARVRMIHRVSINKETSQVECSCGFSIAYEANGKDLAATAAERLNEHLSDRLKVGGS